MTDQGSNSSSDNAIRERLKQIAGGVPQAEIARRTGTSRANVSRYLRTNRIPVSFAARCVEALGVNPDWLLTGKGSPMLADTARHGGQLTGELLDIVQALNTVGQLRIGALGGHSHLRMLRELGDAMSRYGVLRDRLNQLSIPVLRRILQDAEEAFSRAKYDFARDLCRTAEQLSQFSDDSVLAYQRVLLQSKLELISGNVAGAMDLSRRAMYESIRSGEMLGTRQFQAVVDTVEALHDFGRTRDAMHLAGAARSLASEEALRSETASWLDTLVADVHVHSGKLAEGIQLVTKVRGNLVDPGRILRANAILAQSMLYAGALDVHGATVLGGDLPEKAGRLLGFALFTESPKEIETALRYWQGMPTMPRDSWLTRCGQVILKILRQGRSGMVPVVWDLLNARMGSPALPVNWAPIMGAQMYRLLGMSKSARRLTAESAQLLQSLPEWLQPGVMWNARHQRNVLEYGTPSERNQARAFFKTHLASGYLCFASAAST